RAGANADEPLLGCFREGRRRRRPEFAPANPSIAVGAPQLGRLERVEVPANALVLARAPDRCLVDLATIATCAARRCAPGAVLDDYPHVAREYAAFHTHDSALPRLEPTSQLISRYA